MTLKVTTFFENGMVFKVKKQLFFKKVLSLESLIGLGS
ncbi:hypothetical protein STRIC_0685 [Streptococcus ictaluri 707-05]|uniref:Uncharacterized protein n=1 Tax=Streptococcus ictaluri 707-05 TaxID=764299 RepID=G5JZH4_9STRE|nr:hypothetical protein STRIC_0685 [Streptococcus ictaluri 707-05]